MRNREMTEKDKTSGDVSALAGESAAISVLLADDHAIVRDGLRLILESERDISVVGDAADGQEAVRMVCQLRPNVVVMDIAMPGMSGIEATRRIQEICKPPSKVVILSMYFTTEHIYQAIHAGAIGYVLKESAGSEVVKAVRAASSGRRYFSERVTNAMADDFVSKRGNLASKSPVECLNLKEREILQLVVEGRSSKDIGQIVHLSSKSVETYRYRMMQKLGITGVSNLVKFALEHDLTTPT
jgi:DNA-binding NarL/FixJ family response regulator